MIKNGFTIVELLVAVAILFALVVASAAVFMTYERSFRVSGEVNELVDDLRYAKQMSISEQVHHGIEFDFSENSYILARYGEEREELKVKNLADGVLMEDIDIGPEVRFTLFGAVFGSGDLAMHGDDFSKIIKIKPSGYINVERSNVN